MMRYQDIAKKKQRVKRLFWTLLILLLGLVSSGWLSPLGAEVKLCGKPLEPVRDGFYRLRIKHVNTPYLTGYFFMGGFSIPIIEEGKVE
mgnify:CR=1 FL=1